ncbi:MAG TPA: RDD family protein [Solirubrobacteraceae bacterium]|nr:RDD family protein [Solirubrobacteraceae bacterium]
MGDDALGRRIGAAVADLLILAVAFTLVGIVSGGASAQGARVSVQLDTASALVFALIVLAYHFVGEATRGQTPGKQLAGVRVVGLDGGPAGPGAIAIRTLLRIVDSLPVLYLLGLVVVFATGQRRQRIGDLAARTRVVRANATARSFKDGSR